MTLSKDKKLTIIILLLLGIIVILLTNATGVEIIEKLNQIKGVLL